jgi:hypothetical protein
MRATLSLSNTFPLLDLLDDGVFLITHSIMPDIADVNPLADNLIRGCAFLKIVV